MYFNMASSNWFTSYPATLYPVSRVHVHIYYFHFIHGRLDWDDVVCKHACMVSIRFSQHNMHNLLSELNNPQHSLKTPCGLVGYHRWCPHTEGRFCGQREKGWTRSNVIYGNPFWGLYFTVDRTRASIAGRLDLTSRMDVGHKWQAGLDVAALRFVNPFLSIRFHMTESGLDLKA